MNRGSAALAGVTLIAGVMIGLLLPIHSTSKPPTVTMNVPAFIHVGQTLTGKIDLPAGWSGTPEFVDGVDVSVVGDVVSITGDYVSTDKIVIDVVKGNEVTYAVATVRVE